MFPWKLLRKIAGILRGGASGPQIFMAVTLGALGGFVLGPNLSFVLVIFLLLLLNANFGLFLLSLAVGGVCAALLSPLTFSLGVGLLEVPPVRAAVQRLVNAPVTALMGLERYTLLGGLLPGLAIGVVLSFAVLRTVAAFRRRMLSLERGSEGWKAFNRNIVVRALKWLLFGKKKGDYAELLEGERHAPLLRRKGLIAVAVGMAIVAAGSRFALPSVLKAGIERGLGWANGAQVDVGDVDVSVLGGRLYLHDFQMADAKHLDRNVMEFKELGASISVPELFRKRLVFRDAVVRRARLDAKRKTPAKLIAAPLPEEEEAPPAAEGTPLGDYFKQGKAIYDRLEQAQYYLRRLGLLRRRGERPDEEEIRREAKQRGYKNVAATFLIEKRPRFVMERMTIEEIAPVVEGMPELTCELRNLSSDPALMEKPLLLAVKEVDGQRSAAVALNLQSEDVPHELQLALPDIPLSAAGKSLSGKTSLELQEGTVSVSCVGTFSSRELYLPFNVKASGLVARPREGHKAFGLDGEAASGVLESLQELQTTILVHGPIASPRVKLDAKGLLAGMKRSLLQAGKAEAGRLLEGKLDKWLEERGLPEPADELKKRIKGLLGEEEEQKPEKKEDQKKDKGKKEEEEDIGKILDLLR